MALGYKARRRLSLLILLVGVPLYIAVAVTLMNWLDARFGRQPFWVELAIYVGLGILWALPFRAVFLGVGRADPDAPEE
ncbi:hypothetical protein CG51_03870 [Haematobacter missouriensis]|uniref:DUF2842 domain-containing protein n=2 Tax=Haematobacter TaxID=366614 RepID=A0A212AX09_9RHOB|nr:MULTISPECIES: DUF2842 domain-containing protein [Haematobacter]KFI34015.1 hypothetical protein CG51_03870 [Haematobacter missouriensis]OWJ76281.1 hypothetical protein CDV49_14535 [Haematobacter genomosp. 1]OWJ78255.1 hypothetical protein CDV53_03310 [Haematobacter missouriensis]OWJ86005.1 hypothetical protein CDV52_02265 [Haematobacter missouriensis]